MRIEDQLPGFVERRIPDRPDWVADSPRDPRTAAKVYGAFALAFSTLFIGLPALLVSEPAASLWVPLVVANAGAWTWALWRWRIPDAGPVSRRNAFWTGLGIGTLSWLTLGPLLSMGYTAYVYVSDGSFVPLNALWDAVAYGVYYSIGGFVVTLGIPTVASVALALWMIDYETHRGREKREANYDFQ
ncbi:hypothetical protein G9C85_00900 [Halorubellus sp. JP-L1]|uniref:hypothetical protein n=1 Tax=Halorubellus sp. JP-L1 TaxID=2715753 RepID=UPI00140B2D25|nr:hypothetical protein [Halorubellus sp. JP-L1]NHN40193.1 hypothetical protein [Halorubellus sp. JP-L1]